MSDLQGLPKVLLHDHLDGGLRPQTIIDLGAANQVDLPSTDANELENWFHRGANRGSLPLYLEGFQVTTSVMQTEEALRRVAREKAEDLRADGIVYAEVRFAPILHVHEGLNLERVVQAVLDGLEEGAAGELEWGVLICALRSMDGASSLRMAELAIDFRDRGVVGFDLAGDESGHPPKEHLEAFQLLRRQNFNITIHAGEAFGLSSIWQSIQYCGAHRVGHATRLVEDLKDAQVGRRSHGTLLQYVLDHRVHLEMCLSSNVHTGAIPDIDSHPFPWCLRRGFRVSLNTDNYLMSATTLTREWELARDHFGLEHEDFKRLALNGAKSAFIPYEERTRLIAEVILPGFGE